MTSKNKVITPEVKLHTDILFSKPQDERVDFAEKDSSLRQHETSYCDTADDLTYTSARTDARP